MEKKIIELLKEINNMSDKDNIYGYYKDWSYNLDLKNEFLFISLSRENLEKINITNIDKYYDVTTIDLQDLEYDKNILELIIEDLIIIKNNI